MKLALFHQTAKQPLQSTTATMMTAQSEPMLKDARPFSFKMYPDFSATPYKIYGNATILDNGTCAAKIEGIFNIGTKQYERWPYCQELQDAVRAACDAHFQDAAFTRYHITRTSIHF